MLRAAPPTRNPEAVLFHRGGSRVPSAGREGADRWWGCGPFACPWLQRRFGRVRRWGAEPGCALRRARYRRAQRSRAHGGGPAPPRNLGIRAPPPRSRPSGRASLTLRRIHWHFLGPGEVTTSAWSSPSPSASPTAAARPGDPIRIPRDRNPRRRRRAEGGRRGNTWIVRAAGRGIVHPAGRRVAARGPGAGADRRRGAGRRRRRRRHRARRALDGAAATPQFACLSDPSPARCAAQAVLRHAFQPRSAPDPMTRLGAARPVQRFEQTLDGSPSRDHPRRAAPVRRPATPMADGTPPPPPQETP